MRIPAFLRHVAIAALLAATPIVALAAPTVSGIENFIQVNERIYRGAQPEDASWSQLRALGVKTVIDLRQTSEHSTADEARAVEAAGMRYVSVPMNGWETPRADLVNKVVAMLEQPGDTVFVHCKQGKDRTGTVVAAYRISHEGWANARALQEAESNGMHWFLRGMKRYIAAYRPAEKPAGDLASSPQAELVSPAAETPAAQTTQAGGQ
jgi:uncharacterized protein (TIGR01244 family)